MASDSQRQEAHAVYEQTKREGGKARSAGGLKMRERKAGAPDDIRAPRLAGGRGLS